MAVEIDIDNNKVTLNNVATEETLKRLVDKMEGSSSGSTGGVAFKDAVEQTNKMAKGTKKLNVELKGLTKSADDLAEELDDAADSAQGFGSKVGNMANKVMGAAEDVVKFGADTAGVGLTMKTVGGAVDKFASAIPLVGGALGVAGGAIIGHTADLADSFDQLSRTGANFSGNLFDIERAAAKSYLNLEQFGGIIRENSASLAVFGGTAKLGAKRFVDINVAMNETSRDRLRMLGISAEESAEMLGEYITMQQRNTAFQGMSVRQQSQAAANYSEEITKLATLTGQDRKQLAEKMAREKQAADIELRLSEMTAKGNTDTRNSLQLLKEKFGDVPGAMDLVTQGMRGFTVGATTEGNVLLQSPMGQELNKLGQQMRTGTLTQEEVIKRMGSVYEQQKGTMDGMRDLGGFSPIADQMNQSVLALQGVNQQYKVIMEKFGGDMTAYSESLKPDVSEETKTVKSTQMMIEDLGKTTRLGVTKVAEGATASMGGVVTQLKNLVDGVELDEDTKTELTNFKNNTQLAAGAASGLATAATKASKTLGEIAIKNAETVKQITKAVTSTGTSATSGVAKAAAQNVDDGLRGGSAVASAVKGTAAATGSVGSSIASSLLKKIPIFGALATGGINYATSDQDTEVGKISEGVGSAVGSFGGGLGGAALGATIGTAILPVVGTAIGGIIGGIGGAIIGDKGGKGLGGWFADKFGFEDGGIIRQPTLSMIGEGASDEAVVPLANNRSIPVDIDMAPIANLTKSVEKLVEMQNMRADNTELVSELKKMNRQTGQIVKLQS